MCGLTGSIPSLYSHLRPRRSFSAPANEVALLYGRSIRQLVFVWVVALAILALLYFFETSAPAFHELLIPFYWITVAVAGFLTFRWLRSRSPVDRRGNDRRKSARRGDYESAQAADPDRDEK